MNRIIILGAAATTALVIIAGLTAAGPADTGADKEADKQTQSILGYCGTKGCIVDVMVGCKPSETTISYSSNATTVISVGGEGIYQGRPVCPISVYVRDDGVFQSWGCKVPLAALEDYEGGLGDLVSSLTTSEYCVPQVH